MTLTCRQSVRIQSTSHVARKANAKCNGRRQLLAIVGKMDGKMGRE